MDKMTDAKIRAWLNKNNPEILATYQQYQAESLSDLSTLESGEVPRPASLRNWLENRHPEILEQIPLW